MVVPLFMLASVLTLVSAMAYFQRPGRTVGALKLLMPRRDGPDWQSALREQLESASVVSAVTALIAVDISCSLLVMLAELEALEGLLKGSLIEHAEFIGAILVASTCPCRSPRYGVRAVTRINHIHHDP